MRAGTAVRVLLLSGLLVSAAAIAAAFYLGSWPSSPIGLPLQVVNKDFANYWMAGQLASSGRAELLFGPQHAYFDAMKSVFGADYPWHNWSYPPHAVLLLLPLGLLNFLPAMALFLGATLAFYLCALATVPAKWSPMSAILLLPFVIANLVAVQNGFLTTALMVGGLSLRAPRPVLAGILFGILTFKPQLGLLLPIMLIIEGRWRVIASAALTAAALFLVSLPAFGMSGWQNYLFFVAPYQTEVMNTLGGDFPFMMGSAFGSARSYGLTAGTALLVHLPFAAAGIALFGFSLVKVANVHARSFAMLLASLIITPYSVAYDFGAVATFAALWPIATGEQRMSGSLRIPILLVAMLPIAMLPLGQAGLPVTPLILLAALIGLLAGEGAFRRPSLPSPARP
jgi:hypothetical protein